MFLKKILLNYIIFRSLKKYPLNIFQLKCSEAPCAQNHALSLRWSSLHLACNACNARQVRYKFCLLFSTHVWVHFCQIYVYACMHSPTIHLCTLKTLTNISPMSRSTLTNINVCKTSLRRLLCRKLLFIQALLSPRQHFSPYIWMYVCVYIYEYIFKPLCILSICMCI